MDMAIITKKIGARLYLVMMPRISFYGDAKKLACKIVDFLEANPDSQSLGDFLFQELGEKVIQDRTKAGILADILFNDYTSYKALIK